MVRWLPGFALVDGSLAIIRARTQGRHAAQPAELNAALIQAREQMRNASARVARLRRDVSSGGPQPARALSLFLAKRAYRKAQRDAQSALDALMARLDSELRTPRRP